MSQLTEGKWTRKLVRVRKLTQEFDNHGCDIVQIMTITSSWVGSFVLPSIDMPADARL